MRTGQQAVLTTTTSSNLEFGGQPHSQDKVLSFCDTLCPVPRAAFAHWHFHIEDFQGTQFKENDFKRLSRYSV